MKKLLFSLSLLFVCLCFLRLTFANDSLISSEMAIEYISENFKTDETLQDMISAIDDLMTKMDSIHDDPNIKGLISDMEDAIENQQVPILGEILQLLFGTLQILYNIFYGIVYLNVVLVNLVFYAIPIIFNVLHDIVLVLRLFSYLIFGYGI